MTDAAAMSEAPHVAREDSAAGYGGPEVSEMRPDGMITNTRIERCAAPVVAGETVRN
jgi:hypothetical protein